MSHRVSATALNLRSEPRVRNGNRLAVLDQGTPVTRLADADNGWWRVRAILDGTEVDGYVASRYLVPVDDATPIAPASAELRVHMPVTAATSGARARASRHAYPLNEPGQPRRTAATSAGRVTELNAIADWLDVERSARYQRTPGKTYCNIYAYDVCYLAGVYLPRVFWKSEALARVLAGAAVPVVYGQTVGELNANALFDWLTQFGPRLGWRRSFSFDEAQAAANEGEVVVLAAQQVDLNQPGHIVIVLPETPAAPARRNPLGVVVRPVTSEAGAHNVKRAAPASAWWTASKFRQWALWRHD